MGHRAWIYVELGMESRVFCVYQASALPTELHLQPLLLVFK